MKQKTTQHKNSRQKPTQHSPTSTDHKTSETPQTNGSRLDVDVSSQTDSRKTTATTPHSPPAETTSTYRTTDGKTGLPNRRWMNTSEKSLPQHSPDQDRATNHYHRCPETNPYHQRAGKHPKHLTMSEHGIANPQRPLTIRQQNTNKSLTSQLDLLESLKRNEYDICAIQEPYIDFNGKSRANRQWMTVYPNTHHSHPDSTRSLLLINTNLLTDSWKQINFQHPDITAIELKGPFGTIRIINVYNDCNNNNALTQVSNFMRDRGQQEGRPAPIHTIWLGDFNRHHPLWDENRNAHLFTRRNLDLTQPLLDMIGRHNMKMALPPATPTLCAQNTGNLTRVDNVFCMESLMDTLIKCDTDDAARPVKTDHFPIVTQFDIHAPQAIWKPRRNFRLTEWPEFIQTLSDDLNNIPIPTEIHDTNTFTHRLNTLNEKIQNAINKHVKLTKPSPYSKRWWSTDLAKEKKKMLQLGGRARYHRLVPDHPIHEEY